MFTRLVMTVIVSEPLFEKLYCVGAERRDRYGTPGCNARCSVPSHGLERA